MHFFIRRQTNGQTWRGRANQNPMRQQRPPIKRSLLKLPVTNPRSCNAVGQFDIGPRTGPVPYVYTSNIHIYTQGLRACGPRFPYPTSIVPERHGLVLPFSPPLSVTGPFKIWNAVTAKICRKFVQCSRTAGYAAREKTGQLETGWPSYGSSQLPAPRPHYPSASLDNLAYRIS